MHMWQLMCTLWIGIQFVILDMQMAIEGTGNDSTICVVIQDLYLLSRLERKC